MLNKNYSSLYLVSGYKYSLRLNISQRIGPNCVKSFCPAAVAVYLTSRKEAESTDTKSMSFVAFQYAFHYLYAAWPQHGMIVRCGEMGEWWVVGAGRLCWIEDCGHDTSSVAFGHTLLSAIVFSLAACLSEFGFSPMWKAVFVENSWTRGGCDGCAGRVQYAVGFLEA